MHQKLEGAPKTIRGLELRSFNPATRSKIEKLYNAYKNSISSQKYQEAQQYFTSQQQALSQEIGQLAEELRVITDKEAPTSQVFPYEWVKSELSTTNKHLIETTYELNSSPESGLQVVLLNLFPDETATVTIKTSFGKNHILEVRADASNGLTVIDHDLESESKTHKYWSHDSITFVPYKGKEVPLYMASTIQHSPQMLSLVTPANASQVTIEVKSGNSEPRANSTKRKGEILKRLGEVRDELSIIDVLLDSSTPQENVDAGMTSRILRIFQRNRDKSQY